MLHVQTSESRLYKVQGVAAEVPKALDIVFNQPAVLRVVQDILEYNTKQEADEIATSAAGSSSTVAQVKTKGIDVFGTKFFPLWPAGGRSVTWHQDSHYFGTYSPQIVSCGFYIEDTNKVVQE